MLLPLDDMTCRLVKTLHDDSTLWERQYRVALRAAMELEPYCEGHDEGVRKLITQTVESTRMFIGSFLGPGESEKPNFLNSSKYGLRHSVSSAPRSHRT